MNWDVFVVIISVYNSIQIPLELAFIPAEDAINNVTVTVLNALSDFFFLIDIVLNFHTTVEDDLTGEELISKTEIATNYLKFQFWIDMVSTIPFEFIFMPFIG